MSEKSQTELELARAMERLVDDPRSYNLFIDAWNKHVDSEHGDISQLVVRPREGVQSKAVDAVASETLSSIALRDSQDNLRDDVALLLNTFPHSAYLVASGGLIHAVNDLAFKETGLDVGDRISGIGYSLEKSEPLETAIEAALKEADGNGSVHLKRAFKDKEDRPVTIALIRSDSQTSSEKRALMFIIDPVWRVEASQLMKSAFGFSDAEADIVDGFMSGSSLRQIADARERSHATVRTQFQNLLAKAGARSQLDLMRVALGLSQFVKEIEPIARIANRPERRRLDVLRPDNRSVDVLFYGDPQGLPVVFLHSVYYRSFPPFVEQQLHDAGLYFIAPGRPGFGATTKAAKGTSRFECLTSDVEAILDQMGIEKCVLIAQTASTPAAFHIFKHLQHRIDRRIVIASAAPTTRKISFDASRVSSAWTVALIKACKVSPQMAYLVARAGHRLMLSAGMSRFLSHHYSGSPADLEVMALPETIAEFEEGVAFTSKQGIEEAVHDVIDCFENWDHLIEEAPGPVIMAHGATDPHSPIQVIRSLCELFPDKLRLNEFSDGGQMLMASHTQQMIQLIKTGQLNTGYKQQLS
ncbi:alpha/beta fold hydrolase [Pseudahrensia aquimaris]|uniref:Alpha/beta fold hydrolase n=1 Tax=Pseudahrensia aquimaris TaxID=744461 RepID=A0ABW3FFR9_9HYPH